MLWLATPVMASDASSTVASASANSQSQPTNASETASLAGKASSAQTIPSLPANLATAPANTGAGMLQVFMSLGLVLALLIGVAWALKRFGPQHISGGAHMRIVGGMSLGGRERVLVLEVGDQWIVIGAAPGRVNALATMPKQDQLTGEAQQTGNGLADEKNFATWLKANHGKTSWCLNFYGLLWLNSAALTNTANTSRCCWCCRALASPLNRACLRSPARPAAGGGQSYSLSIQTLLFMTSLTFLPAMYLDDDQLHADCDRALALASSLRHANISAAESSDHRLGLVFDACL